MRNTVSMKIASSKDRRKIEDKSQPSWISVAILKIYRLIQENSPPAKRWRECAAMGTSFVLNIQITVNSALIT